MHPLLLKIKVNNVLTKKKKKNFMRHHMCDGIVTGYERAVITTGQSYNIVPQWEKKHLITKFLKFFDETTEPFANNIKVNIELSVQDTFLE